MQRVISIRQTAPGVCKVIIHCPFVGLECSGKIEIEYLIGQPSICVSSASCPSCGVVVALTEESKRQANRRGLEIGDRVHVGFALDGRYLDAVGLIVGLEIQGPPNHTRMCVVKLESGEEIKVLGKNLR